MIRTLLTTTAVALLMATPTFAQNATTPTPDAMAPAQDSMAAPGMQTDLMTTGYMALDTDHFASRLMGKPIYTSAADDAEKIGDINDIVLTADGQIAAVVVGVGGFLGIGEKNVAVGYSELDWQVDSNNMERLVLPVTKESLEAAAQFEWPQDDSMMAAEPMTTGTMNTTTTPGAMDLATPADPNAPVDPNMSADVAAANTTPLDFGTMTPLETGTLTAEELIGTRVIGADDQDIAGVGDIVLTPSGEVDALLVDFGGFLGIGQKRVAVGTDNLNFLQDQNGIRYVRINATKEQLDAAPAYDQATYETTRLDQRLVVTN